MSDAYLAKHMPIDLISHQVSPNAGLVIVDAVVGFCVPSAGNLAPRAEDLVIDGMIARINCVARKFNRRGMPIWASRDEHQPGVPEPPYPEHCVQGSGEELLVGELEWLNDNETHAVVIPKNCLNGFVSDGPLFIQWARENGVAELVVCGICTDLCILDLVGSILAARNRGAFDYLRNVVVYEPACATYDLPLEVATRLGLPPAAAHPREIAHYIGLSAMAARGAILAHELVF